MAPRLDGAGGHAELRGHLVQGEHAGVAEPLLPAAQPVFVADVADDQGVEGAAFAAGVTAALRIAAEPTPSGPVAEIDESAPVALASRNPETQTVTLVLDTSTANAVMFAIAAHADEREAHIREVRLHGQTFPKGSYGHRNRQAIAARETRVAARLRAVEHAYRMANERDIAFRAPEPARACRSPGYAADGEMELE